MAGPSRSSSGIVVNAPRRLVKPAPSTLAIKNTGPPRGPGFTDVLLPEQEKSLEIYKRAVTHEQRGEIDDALRLYKQAFRIHEDVARIYERQESLPSNIIEIDSSPIRIQREGKRTLSELDTIRLTQDMSKLHVSSDSSVVNAFSLPANHGVVTGTLASIISSWASLSLTFEREDETQPVHMQTLPDELLVHVLNFLDTTTLERFALIDRKARVLTLDSTIWRYVRCHTLVHC